MRLPRMPLKGRNLAVLTSAASLAVASLLGGCKAKSFIDPSELGRGEKQRGDTLTVKIIDQLDPGLEEIDSRFRGAQDVQPQDHVSATTDYQIGPGDVVDVAVTDLTGQGIETVNTRQVTESGNLILPLLKNPIRVEDMTEPEVAQAVTQAYKNENIITDAQVAVTLRLKRNRTYSILGAIESPGEYEITTNDFRLLNAMTQARDVSRNFALGVRWLYIVRKTKHDAPT
ncbi:MAG: polysaccharide biosynthesis/export family protein, partial [Tepidisphaeraceae bacterium]